MLGIVVAILAAVGWGSGAVLARQGMVGGIRPVVGTFLSLISSLIFTVVVALLVHPGGFAKLTPAIVGWFALIGILNFPLGRQLNYQAISRIGAARATPVLGASSLFSILIAVVFTGETVTAMQIAGALMVVGGITLVMSAQS